MKRISSQRSQIGFTLIELLIVISIIGILVGIVIAILNPARQQQRARDAVVIATMTKMAAEVRAFAAADITGVGTFPTCAQLAASLQNVATSPCNGVAPGDSMTFTGVVTGASQGFRYVPTGAVSFCISAGANDTAAGNFLRMNTAVAAESTPIRAAAGC